MGAALRYIFERVLPYLPLFFAAGIILYLLLVYYSTREHYGTRIVITRLWQIAVFVLGWWIGKGLGLLLITLPILVIYYYFLFHLAAVVIPPSDPDSFEELWHRFFLFLWYQGVNHYPVWVVPDSCSRTAEVRIEGDQFGSFSPGLVWARSHQVVGLTTGLSFSGTRQPGTILTGPYERPFTVVDLRTQLRTATIEAVSSDGIPYSAVLFASFAVDKERWSPGLYHQLYRTNPMLKNAQELDCTRGTYKFSRARMLALFNTMGVSPASDGRENPKPVEWDQRVMFQLEKAAREVLSQRRIDELWQPQIERPGANAMDDIASAIKDKSSLELRQHGVNLFSCRIVNFDFSKSEHPQEKLDDVKHKHITAWSADWQREAEQTRAEGKAEAELLKQEARAYAYTNLLTAVAEAFQETRLLNPNLPRQVIAVQFISALERLIDQQPDLEGISEARSSLSDAKKMLPWVADMDKTS